ncbi:MAG: LPS export ABC transporter periplasmic protein LptC [Opitutae bacterium]|nr:LPS export ABC transporter periplasmic protein LptC [Opitutae bacterium]
MLSKTLLRSILGLLCLCTLQAQMTPSAPVQNFRLPRFGENGFTQWVLQGGKGIYDSAEQIRIENMALRVYSGDERMALEMTMDSPEATLFTAENRAVSDGPITIVGANFKVSGVGWTWNGLTKQIEVKFDVVVEFTQGMAGMLTGAVVPEETVVERTEIHSRSLLLHTTAEAYRFTFTDSVHAASGEMDLKSEVLVAVADAPKGKEGDGSTVAGGTIDSIRHLIATDHVVIHQGGHVLKAGHAEFRLREQAAEFTGNPEILAASGAYLSGATIRSQEGLVFVTGNADDGRAQLIVSQAQGLGILGAQVESAETIVLADSITMRELETGNQFLFDGSVEVMSGLMIMYSNQLTLFADQPVKGVATTATTRLVAGDAEVLKVGEVRRVLAEGAVRIEQANKVATSDKAIFYPQEERAELFGSPRVTDGEVIITGDRMELKPGIAVVYSDTDKRVKVVLPEIADLGYEDSQALTLEPNQSQQPPQKTQTQQAPGSETVVESKTLRMIEETDKTLFRFTESVSVSGTNVHALCERLDVTAVAVQVAETKESQLEVQTIEAFDNVVFKQTGRVATGDLATIRPIEGKVVLEGNAVVTDEMGKVSGHRMILLQGQRRAIVEGDRSTGKRATMTLPEMKPRSK